MCGFSYNLNKYEILYFENFLILGLHHFIPEEKVYDIMWVQWVL